MQTGSQGFHIWTEHELSAFLRFMTLDQLPIPPQRCMLSSGCGSSWLAKRKWCSHSVSPPKNATLFGGVADIPIHPGLQKVFDRLSKSQMTFLETRSNRSRSASGLGNAMRKWCNAANLPDCSSHGLRKACATRLAEAGASEREIMAWTGHTLPQMVQIYAGKARRGLMADQGFAKLLQNETGSKTDEPNSNGSTKS